MTNEEQSVPISRRFLIKSAGVLAVGGTTLGGTASADESSNWAVVLQRNKNRQIGGKNAKQIQFRRQRNRANVKQKATTGESGESNENGASNVAIVAQSNSNSQIGGKNAKQVQVVSQRNKATVTQTATSGDGGNDGTV